MRAVFVIETSLGRAAPARTTSFFAHSLPAFGQPTGFAVSYSCDFAVRFDLEVLQEPIALRKQNSY
jgi:hypothetical protein